MFYRPFQGGILFYAQFLGLKPQAQAYHPFGVQTDRGRCCEGPDRSQIATGISGWESGNVLPPFQGGHFTVMLPGLKPRAESCSPFGTKSNNVWREWRFSQNSGRKLEFMRALFLAHAPFQSPG
jgi:hypothetical protein